MNKLLIDNYVFVGSKKGRKVIASWEMFLLVTMTVAIAFILSESAGLGSATVGDLAASGGGATKLEPMSEWAAKPAAGAAKSVTTIGTKAVNVINMPAELGNVPANYFSTAVGSNGFSVGSTTKFAADAQGLVTATNPGGATATFTPAGWAEFSSGAAAKGITLTPQATYQIFGMGPTFTGVAAHLVQGLVWAGVAVLVIQLAGKLFGLEKGLTNSLSYSAVGGIAAYKTILALGPGGTGAIGPGSALLTAAPFIGIGVAVAIFILTYKTEKKKTITFQCLPWEAPIGGAKCEECNKDKFRLCSEYRCKALGQACQLLNVGTAEENCAWVNPKDVNSPTIKPSPPLTDGLKYIPDTAIRPPALGVKIIREGASGGCLQAFTPLKFSLETNEPAQCKINYAHTGNFENMTYYVGENNYYEYNHTQYMKLPGLNTGVAGNETLAPEIKNDGTYSFYVRCRDANGNENVDEFLFSFCVDKGPDTTPPVIDGSSIVSGSPVQYNVDSIPIDIYVNEPSECKWSRLDKAYDDMENMMDCATQTYQINSNLDYTCSGTLTGIQNSKENKFFFRCKDNPGKAEKDRNVNSQSYPLMLKGTKTLNIMKTAPNGTIYESTSTITVNLEAETANGAEEGKAVCYFSNTGNIDSFVAMFETNSNTHKQSLDLATGSYTYYFRCIDAGGNSAEDKTSFNVFVDKTAPKITRIYREGTDALKIVTNEDAECSYSLTSCNFKISDGVKMLYPSADIKNIEISEWKPNVIYYVRCKDMYENEPLSNECSMVASAAEIA